METSRSPCDLSGGGSFHMARLGMLAAGMGWSPWGERARAERSPECILHKYLDSGAHNTHNISTTILHSCLKLQRKSLHLNIMTSNLTAKHADSTPSSPHLWIPHFQHPDFRSQYQLRVSVLKDKEEQGNCAIKSLVSTRHSSCTLFHLDANMLNLFKAVPCTYSLSECDRKDLYALFCRTI